MLQKLTQYKKWADKLFFEAVSELSHEQHVAKQSIYFGSLLRTLHHSYAMDAVWKGNFQGLPHGYTSRNPDNCPSFEQLYWQQLEIDQWYCDCANQLNNEQASQICEFDFIGGGKGRMSRSDIIIHVVNHCTYHRGHVATMMYEYGVMPPTTDYPVFIRL